MQLIANLLAYPEQVQEVDVKPSWFTITNLKSIVKAVKQTNGEVTRLKDLAQVINEDRTAFTKLTEDDLKILKDSNEHQKGYFSMAIPYFHKDWVQGQIKEYAKLYAAEQKQKHLDKIGELKEELESIEQPNDNGELTPVKEYLEALFSGEIQPHFIHTFPQFDSVFGGGFQRDRLYVLGARPSVGKSAMAMNIAKKALDKNKEMRVDLFSLESTKQQTAFRTLSTMRCINSKDISNPNALKPNQRELLLQDMEKLMAKDFRIYEANYRKLNLIVNRIRERATVENYLAVIDYAHLIEVSDSRKTEVERLSEVTRALKLLANEMHIPIILLSQINREGVAQQVPTISKLRGSGSLEQDADCIILMYRKNEEDPESVSVVVGKNRDGQIGELAFRFIPEYTKFE